MNIPAAMEEVFPRAQHYSQPLDEAADRYDITTTLRAAHWLGTLAHESGEFRQLRENMNYSADGLQRTFPSRFPDRAMAEAYAHKPEKIANKVYANRFGNGDEASGDGWKFRGGGFTGLTFFDNYYLASLSIYEDDRLIRRPELIEMPEAAGLTAGWFWHRNRLNLLADKDDLVGIRKKVQGGVLGLEHVRQYVERFKAAL